MRLAAIQQIPVTFVWTHDSVALGEDGPTHQPIEHLAALRAIPGLAVVRPADANETAFAWLEILKRRGGPAGIALTRQAVPTFDRTQFASAELVAKGAYVLADTDGEPDVILIATGSEVSVALAAREQLAGEGIKARVVSLPCLEWFYEQDEAYQQSVLPGNVKARVSVEAGATFGWAGIVGDHGELIGPGAVAATQHKVAALLGKIHPPGSANKVGEFDRFVRNKDTCGRRSV